MTKRALITGASSGIGREFALYHAAQGGDLILTARREGALNDLAHELRGTYAVNVEVFACDLGTPGAAEQFCADVTAADLEVDILINCAGFGGLADHIERPLADELAMIDLNVKALVTLTHTFGKQMAARGSGKILNVGSSAGFMPGPLQAVYFATKAFVNSYSQALDEELREYGVTSTVLTPGYVETGFASRADMEGTDLTKSVGPTAAEVAKMGYDAMIAGDLVKIDRPSLAFAINWLIPLLPRRMVLKYARKLQTKEG